MSNLSGLNIDPNVKETGDFELLPAGKYKIVIISDELKDTKAGNGKLLELILQVQDGEFQGTEIKDRLNLMNPSKIAQDIGQGTLKRICNITETPFPPTDSRKLWGKPMSVKVAVKEFESNTTGETLKSNEIKSYSKVKDLDFQVSAVTTEKSPETTW